MALPVGAALAPPFVRKNAIEGGASSAPTGRKPIFLQRLPPRKELLQVAFRLAGSGGGLGPGDLDHAGDTVWALRGEQDHNRGRPGNELKRLLG